MRSTLGNHTVTPDPHTIHAWVTQGLLRYDLSSLHKYSYILFLKFNCLINPLFHFVISFTYCIFLLLIPPFRYIIYFLSHLLLLSFIKYSHHNSLQRARSAGHPLLALENLAHPGKGVEGWRGGEVERWRGGEVER